MPLDEERWEARLEELREFKSRSGHCNVSQKHPGGLGRWVHTQRWARKEGRLDPRRVRKLEDEGFRWAVCRGGNWEARFEELRTFRGEHGHCDVPEEHAGGLGAWVRIQRALRGTGRLDVGRARRLEEEGIRWEACEDGRDPRFGRERDVPQKRPGGRGKRASNKRDVRQKRPGGRGKRASNRRDVPEKRPGGIGKRASNQLGEPAARPMPAEEPRAFGRGFGGQEHAAEAYQGETGGGPSAGAPAHTSQVVNELMRMYNEAPGAC